MAKIKTKILLAILTASLLSLTLAQATVNAEPPKISLCTENSQLDNTVCKGGAMVACDSSHKNQTSTNLKLMCDGSAWTTCSTTTNGTKSPDGTLTCDGSTTTWKANPQPPCTEGQTSDNKTQLCQNGSMVICNSSNDGTKSANNALQCTSGTWQTPAASGNSCTTNGGLNSDSSKICQNNLWVTCSGSNSSDTISGKQCTSGKWVTPTPSNPDPDPPSNPASPTAKITKHSVYPAGFNPTLTETKISYTISQKAVINLTITNDKGETVGTPVKDQTSEAKSHFTYWYGTKENKKGGTVLPAGTYHYKIVAKNTKDNKVDDSKTGDINLIYTSSGFGDFDNPPPPPADQAKVDPAQVIATLAIQNAKTGKTSKTGPDVLIYGLLPLAGYFMVRRRSKN